MLKELHRQTLLVRQNGRQVSSEVPDIATELNFSLGFELLCGPRPGGNHGLSCFDQAVFGWVTNRPVCPQLGHDVVHAVADCVGCAALMRAEDGRSRPAQTTALLQPYCNEKG